VVKKGLTEQVPFGQRLKGGKCFIWWEKYKAEETAKGKIPQTQLEVCVWQSEASDGRRERQREGRRERKRSRPCTELASEKPFDQKLKATRS
jgi:hypothetical protein